MLVNPQYCNYPIERHLIARWPELAVGNQVEMSPYLSINTKIKVALAPFVQDLRYTEVEYVYRLGSRNAPTARQLKFSL